jgi:hypothetical protein
MDTPRPELSHRLPLQLPQPGENHRLVGLVIESRYSTAFRRVSPDPADEHHHGPAGRIP